MSPNFLKNSSLYLETLKLNYFRNIKKKVKKKSGKRNVNENVNVFLMPVFICKKSRKSG